MKATSRQELPIRHAVALGLLHGPTELLPVSSSGHTTLVPWIAGWPYGGLEPELRKSFEVALHVGTAAALLVRPPCPLHGPSDQGRPTGVRRLLAKLGLLLPALAPPAFAGYALGPPIERRLGTPATIAGGLLAGSVAMIATELRAYGSRPAGAARARDGVALGLAQTLALMPGVSRSGATIAAARARGFSRQDADRLSWRVGLPLIASAALLKSAQLGRKGIPRHLRLPLAVGTTSAFLSTLASARVLSPSRRAALLPICVVYRAALALFVIRRMRDNTSGTSPFLKK